MKISDQFATTPNRTYLASGLSSLCPSSAVRTVFKYAQNVTHTPPTTSNHQPLTRGHSCPNPGMASEELVDSQEIEEAPDIGEVEDAKQ